MKFKHEWIQDTLNGIDNPGTQKRYGRELLLFWEWYNGADLTVRLLNSYKSTLLAKGLKSSSIKIALAAIKMAIDNNAMPETIQERIEIQEIMRLIKIKATKPSNYAVSVGDDELGKLFSQCNTSDRGVRDLAIFCLLFFVGLRRGEVTGLTLLDYDRVNSLIFVREGKGNKNRVVPISSKTATALDNWLERRANVAKDNALFCSLHRHKGRGMCVSTLNVMMRRRCKEAGISHYHPHDGRSSYITKLHNEGVPIGNIQVLVGHSSAATTLGYVRLDMDSLKKNVSETFV